ncbi:uncharacterized protein LOC123446731 [Hordeum vulgare subsp. vulgare]|uniref:Uncharacterized protein n=1 Tax=Hordeum vulgare subsp. vulgare TaxID=112509 RepID=A0A8I6X3I2_HORVV|nr:uncharacterized protein LOC123446731 [Hordeum vulgare subsp. vulgare]KAI4993547.1 hypothetical protein ZWY2020_007860 [Hordeum vulgare]
MPLSAASILRASSLALLLLAATATGGDGSTTSDSSVAQSIDDTEMYLCYLCTGRNPMLIRYCPIYWDWCHLVCYAPDVAAGPAASLRPAAEATAPRETYAQLGCYVMKLYRNGTYVIVSRHDCSKMASCILSCGGGDVADRKTLGAAPLPVTATAPQGMLPSSRVAEFQRCGDQAMGLPLSAVPGRV